jgi:FtsH-binding integral membrane protein
MTMAAARPRPVVVVLATAMWAFYVVGVAATLVVRADAHAGVWQAFIIPFTAFATVGWLIAVRRPEAPLGWLFLGIGVLTSAGVVTDAVVQMALDRGWTAHGVVLFSAWVQMWYWYPLLGMSTAYTLLLFPNGLPSRRWRPVLWLLTLGLAAMVVTAAIAPTIDFGKAKIPNPIGVASDWKDVENSPVFNVAGLVLMGCLLASVVSLGVRFRRARGLERAQLKWFFLGAAVLGVFVISALVSPTFNNSKADQVMAPFVFTAVPVACGFAILRYRLYDIDRIVSRAVSYLVVTGVIVAFYVGVIAGVESVLGFSSSIAVAASTLAAAAAFQPLRRRVQRRVDRRFDRAAYDARRTVDAFAARLRDQVDVDAVRSDLLATVASAVAPAAESLWVATR